MATFLMPVPRARAYTDAGAPAAAYLLYTYAAGTTTPKAAYTDAAGLIAHPNPIPLDAKGEAVIYFDGNYKLELKTPAGVTVTGYPVDNYETPLMAGSLLATAGGGMIGFLYAAVYSTGTVGRWLQDLATSVGTSFIGFIQSGTGAVTRNLQARLRERISVADFGAVGDGVTDDAAAIQLALNAAAGKALHFTHGATYRCNSTLTIKGDTTKIYGCGATINSYATGSAITCELVGGTRYLYNINIEDLSLNAYGSGSYGFRCLASYSTFRRFSIGIPAVNIGGRGFALIGDEANGTGPYYNSFVNCDAQSGSAGLDHIGFSLMSVAPTFNRAPNSNTFIGCRAASCFQNFNIKGDANVFINPCAESPIGVGTAFTFEATTATNCVQNFIYGGRMESPSVGIAFSANARDNIVTGMFGTGVTTWKNDLGTGNQVHTAIGSWSMPSGVNFPTLSADTSALDYYGEGTWAPVPTNITTNSGAPVWAGTYTRIGNLVSAHFVMSGGNVTINAGTSQITLPFTSAKVDWGVFANNTTTAFTGGVGTFGTQLYFSSALTSSAISGTITYRV